MKKILRVFPRRTRATPDDELVRVGEPPGLFDSADEVHISVTFTWDISAAERLARQWEHVSPIVKVGGPATGERGGEFEPGLYLKKGYVITSRGCPNRCWFCSVWKREGKVIRELEIKDGWNVLDDNLLACSDEHIKSVFEMLSRQDRKAEFTGGLEAARLKQWHCDGLKKIKAKRMYFAYDTPDDYEPLVIAGRMMRESGFKESDHSLCAYVLCGFPGDTTSKAEKRMNDTLAAGFMPRAMRFNRIADPEWSRFQKAWSRPHIIYSRRNDGLHGSD